MTRKAKKKPSNPKLEALGWDDKEATEVIELGLERVRRTSEAGREAYQSSLEVVARAKQKLDDLEAEVLDSPGTPAHALG